MSGLSSRMRTGAGPAAPSAGATATEPGTGAAAIATRPGSQPASAKRRQRASGLGITSTAGATKWVGSAPASRSTCGPSGPKRTSERRPKARRSGASGRSSGAAIASTAMSRSAVWRRLPNWLAK
jgi:hypothetical protein